MNNEDRAYIKTAMYMAMGALKVLSTAKSRVGINTVVRQLEVAVGKLDSNRSSEGRRAGGYARAKSLSPERRKEIASAAGKSRWNPQG